MNQVNSFSDNESLYFFCIIKSVLGKMSSLPSQLTSDYLCVHKAGFVLLFHHLIDQGYFRYHSSGFYQVDQGY